MKKYEKKVLALAMSCCMISGIIQPVTAQAEDAVDGICNDAGKFAGWNDSCESIASSDESVVSVSPFGGVNALDEGTATVTAATQEGLTASVELTVTKKEAATTDAYLSDLEWIEQSCGGGNDFPDGTAKDTNISGNPIVLRVDGETKTFAKGLGIHAPSSVTYDIAGKGYTRFEAYAGVDDSQAGFYPAEAIIGNFIVKIDGEKVAESGEMNPTMDAHRFEVEIPADAEMLTLETEIGQAEDWSDWGNWADAKLVAELGDPENLALNKIPVVKKTSDGSDAQVNGQRPESMATDGIIDTNNYCDFGTDDQRESLYLQVDLESVEFISQVNLWRYWADGRTYKGTVIAVSEDEEFTNPKVVFNSDRENVHGFGAGTDSLYAESEAGRQFELDQLTKGRYVRVYTYGVDSAATTNHIVELQVMGYHTGDTQKPEGPTLAPVDGNNIRVHVEKGQINLYRGEDLVASSASLGKVTANGKTYSDFAITDSKIIDSVETDRGEAARLELEMYSEKGKLKKTLWLDLLKEIDGAIFTTTFLEAEEDMKVTEVVENEFTLAEPDASKIWSYNGGGEGTQSWYDTLQKVNNSFYRENKQDDTAAAIPVADIYSVKGGVTVGDGALYRRFLTTPVKGGGDSATVSINWKNNRLAAGEKAEVGTSIVGVHDGDYYNGLRTFANVMEAQGFATPDYVPESSYDLRWESWGWEGAWTIDKILGKLDDLYAQGIRQITLDDCWYTSAGDWELNPEKFPNGVADMKRLTDAIHEKGMTIAIWWRPMDGGRETAFSVLAGFTQQPSKLLAEHPEYFVKNEDGSFAKLAGPGGSGAFNGSTGYALCPYSEGAVESQKDFIRRAMTEWGIDGFKSDYVWGVPKCYNEAHNHKRPEESTEMASNIFYEELYNEMIAIDQDVFHLLCNCGAPQDYYSFPYVTQIPTADPTSVDQTRRRVKAYKALAGDDFPVTTDHNEIWYPSTVGTGGLLIEKRDFAKGSAQEQEYYKWLNIADTHKLHEGTHIGDLYAYGIDPYETYVVQKDNMMYYGFYCDGNKYRPEGHPAVTLKGLDPNQTYRIEDYVNNVVIAEEVSGAEAVFEVDFSQYLLVRAIPIEEESVDPAVIAELEEIIETAKEMVSEKTVSSAKNLVDLIKEAETLLNAEDMTQGAVEDMIVSLKEGMESDELVNRGNTEELGALIALYSDLNESDYTVETWTVYEAALRSAQAIVDDNSDSSQADVDAAYAALETAREELKDAVVVPDVNKGVLEKALEAAKEFDSELYTISSYEVLLKACARAEEFLDSDTVTQEQVDAAADNVDTAVKALVKRADTADAKKLLDKIAGKNLKGTEYTAQTWKNFVDAKNALEAAVKNNSDISEKEMRKLYNALKEARDGLKKKTEVKPNPDGDKNDNNNNSNNNKKDDPSVKTGDTASGLVWTLLLMTVSGLLIVFRRKKEW